MNYMLLIYGDGKSAPDHGTPEFGEMMQAYGAFTEEVRGKDIMGSGDALQGVETATTVRVRGGNTETTDGPFAETKETLGGFYILDCKDLDEAIEYAAKIPGAQYGSIEVRPVMVFD